MLGDWLREPARFSPMSPRSWRQYLRHCSSISSCSAKWPAAGLQGVNFTLVALALVDPPERPEGEDTPGPSGTQLIELFFPVPERALNHPALAFTCPDGTVITDKAGADVAEEAFKEWEDIYKATAKARDLLPI
jgi:hypothetical protein